MMKDVTLVVDGGYPFTVGGVSEWTSNLVAGLPDVSFAVAALCDPDEPVRAPAYALPPNVTCVEVETPHELPEARVYHALSTGAAGAFAARAAAERGSRFVLSEHGLAWLEARLGISGCKPVYAPPADPLDVDAQAREAYAHAHAVTAVCSWNARLQEHAARRAVRVIENAVRRAPERRREEGPPLVGFVGRVVPIKDVVTFLRACRLVADELPSARFAVVGPLGHVPVYARRCRELAAQLGLDVVFTGETDPGPWYERLDVLVLTSRSEAQPLVALEAMAAGVPVVATGVGGCSELLAGAGLVTPVGSPAATAAAVLRLLHDERLRPHVVAAGRARVAGRHDPARMLRSFHELYEAAAA
jgi:glycosyltransferase involved in cell wall biosynthesis